MFIITLGDVLGIIFIALCLIIGAGAFVIDKFTDYSSDKPKDKPVEQKAQPKPKTPAEPPRPVPLWIKISLLSFIFIFSTLIVLLWLTGQK